MLFNSIDFAIFLPIVFSIYWVIGNEQRRAQNLFLLVASYVFYGWWDWRFLSLILVSSAVDYALVIFLSKSESRGVRRLLLITSLSVNLGLLGYFKYWNFFADNFVQAFSLFGVKPDLERMSIILPVGISFYTFQTLSYTIDAYRRRISPTKDAIAFFAFVSFFPQLVAGPIERAANLLPQFHKARSFDYGLARDGLRQIMWGLFKKVVIADACAAHANDIFQNYHSYSSPLLILGVLYFTFQIYGDFSGYSDIAIGTAKLFGFRLMRNFSYPYFSRDIAEFWRRWHISLSSWFRDYVYIPLGGSKVSLPKALRNVIVVFLVSGLWHGANWTFVVWGALNALYFIPLMVRGKNRHNLGITADGRRLPSWRDFIRMSLTFFLTMFAWTFFRAESLGHAFSFIGRILLFQLEPTPLSFFEYVPLIVLLVVWEWLQRDRHHGLEIDFLPMPIRWACYYVLLWLILYFSDQGQEFIYFQF